MRRKKHSKNQLPPANPLTEACRSPALWFLVLCGLAGLILRGYSTRGTGEAEAPAPPAEDMRGVTSGPLAKEVRQTLSEGTAPATAEKAESLLVPTSAASPGDRPEGVPQASVEAIASWADRDLKSAYQWALGATSTTEVVDRVLTVSEVAARSEPAAAIDVAAGLEPSLSRDRALSHAVSQWADTQPEQAAQWAGQVQDPALRNELVAAVAVASAEEHPEFAGDLVVTNLTAGPTQNNAVVSVVQRWVQRAPEAAAAWVSEFPESPARDAAAENLFGIWTVQDRPGAERYIGQLPRGWLRDAGQLALLRAPARADIQPDSFQYEF